MFLLSSYSPEFVIDPKGDHNLFEQIKTLAAKQGSSIEHIKEHFFAKNADVSMEKLKTALEKALTHQGSALCVKYVENTTRPQLLNSLKNSKDMMMFDFADSSYHQSEPYTLISYEMYLAPQATQKEVVDLTVMETINKKTQNSSFTICLVASHEPISMDMDATYPFYTKHLTMSESCFDFNKYTNFLVDALNELTSSFELTLQP